MNPTATTTTARFIYRFGGGTSDGGTMMKPLLGGKGADLCEMAGMGLPVPPGFVISTDACKVWNEAGSAERSTLPASIWEGVLTGIADLETTMGLKFGVAVEGQRPLLVSVRSGAPVSMPGMMDTVLNLGLNEELVKSFAEATGNHWLAWDAWRRFIQMFGTVVLGMEHAPFDEILATVRQADSAATDAELSLPALQRVADEFRELVRTTCGPDALPSDPMQQLEHAIAAVFASWNGEPARVYRAHYGISDSLGTAVNVQSMVFGNAGNRSASGVLFTRNPATGERAPYGEYLLNAQGEDVVSGMRTPAPVSEASKASDDQVSLEKLLPDTYRHLCEVIDLVERHYLDAQDLEFCVEEGQLWMLQARSAKRTTQAALRIAVEMVGEGLIDRKQALRRLDPEQMGHLLVPHFDPDAKPQSITQGLAASPGAAAGILALDSRDAVARTEAGESVVLVRGETSAADIAGMVAAIGVLTARGGATSHAAVVARGLGCPCVVACSDLDIDEAAGTLTIGDRVLRVGDGISIDGTTGDVYAGLVPTIPGSVDPLLEQLLEWADEYRKTGVLANADTADDARKARSLGAEGIGLCRTEHMFFGDDRLPHFVRMILARDDDAEKQAALEQLAPAIEGEFREMFAAMDGLPVTIRLLDPPLHEFLPRTHEQAEALVKATGRSADEIMSVASTMREENPMLGHRGVRLGITDPIIYELQARSIARAAIQAVADGVDARPHIMIPLIAVPAELARMRAVVARVIAEEQTENPHARPIPIGTMLEVPSACLMASEVAQHADFISFGTNDLTQLTLGLSRDDAVTFLPDYVEQGILPADPFVTVDQTAVAPLMRSAIRDARAAKPGIEVGVCGEHGGDPESITVFIDAGVDYVSCSPMRVPSARLAAASAGMRDSSDRTS